MFYFSLDELKQMLFDEQRLVFENEVSILASFKFRSLAKSTFEILQ